MERSISDNTHITKLRTFCISEKFMLILFGLACIVTVFDIEVFGVLIFASIISLLLVICDDLMVTTLPFLLLCETLIKCYGSYNLFIQYIWLAVPILSSLVFHLVYYRSKIVIGKCFWAILAVSISITVGGLGFISADEYFTLQSFYYVFGLGFGMLIIYVLLSTYINTDHDYSLKNKLSDIMLYMGLFAVFMIIEFYFANIEAVIEAKGIIYMQWRNNISTFLMLAMPFAAFKAVKKPSYIFLSMLFYGAILLAGSRGGLLFGGIEFVMSISILIGIDKRNRWTFVAICLGIILAIAMFFQDFYGFFGETFNRLVMGITGSESEVRMNLFARAFKDFNANPIFGTGLAYQGNMDVHHAADFALCWYHCEPLQIIGSLGVVGILAYCYQLFTRMYIFLKKRTVFNVTLLVSYLGLEMMSLVNPGVFCPLPYLFLVTMFVVIVEKVNVTEKAMPNSLSLDIENNQEEQESDDFLMNNE